MMGAGRINIDKALVRRLLNEQFPQWQNLPVQPVKSAGWDNRVFHLGDHMLVRLPSAQAYAAQVGKEQHWLPRLAPLLPLPIPQPLALGQPSKAYPYPWSIYHWLEGEAATVATITDLSTFACELAQFLNTLRSIDTAGGPPPGADNFYRGGPLATYDTEVRQAIATLKDKLDIDLARQVWKKALDTSWDGPPVWVHGDISTGNLLVRNGQLGAVIDFGLLAIGDPACDLAIAWTLFAGESREAFRKTLSLDAATWQRGRAWALWKALIIAANLTEANAVEANGSWHVIREILADR